MQPFRIHTIDSAPEGSRQGLQALQKNFGFIPNAAATMANSPVLLNAFIAAFGSFHGGSFTEAEKQALLLTNAVALKCAWTTAFHSTLALKTGVAPGDVAAIRDGRLPADRNLAALSALGRALIDRKGHGAAAQIEQFVAAGHAQAQVLDVIAGIAISTMAALTATVADTPVEDMFKAQRWDTE
ncbi:MAG TPA: carboxymuconolactone decarboxylase family protein [Burkholderiaceae bacterium]